MEYKIAYLPESFMLMGIIGFLFSAIWLYPKSPTYGFAFASVFAAIFGASLISMAHAPIPDEKYSIEKLKKK